MSEDLFRQYDECRLCPRQCGARRSAGQTGFCGETDRLRIAAILPHFGEEPSLAGEKGSGTVFFSGCSCGCFFCQNHQISQERVGREYSQEQFLDALRDLLAKGVHNLNFVTPDHWWPAIADACQTLRGEGVEVPFLWNCSGYALAGRIAEIARVVDVFLPDFKFADGRLAQRCMGDSRYPELALAAIESMVENRGFLRPWDTSGQVTASCGTMVRHLVLPGQVENSIAVLDTLNRRFGPSLPLSLMSQFMPMPACHERGFLTEKLALDDYRRVCDYAVSLGFYRVYTQLGTGDDGFAPDFTKDNPFPGNR